MGVELLFALRFAKFLAIALFLAGLAATFASERLEAKRRSVGLLVAPGFLLTWGFGFALAMLVGHSLFAPFILYTLLASFVSLQAALFYGLAEDRPRRTPLRIAVLCVIASFYFMVYRHAL